MRNKPEPLAINFSGEMSRNVNKIKTKCPVFLFYKKKKGGEQQRDDSKPSTRLRPNLFLFQVVADGEVPVS